MTRAALQLGMIAVAAGLLAALVGCEMRPVTSADSIYHDADRPPDPSLAHPYLDQGAPGRAKDDTADLPEGITIGEKPPEPIAEPESPAFQSADVMVKPPGFTVWVDGHVAALSGSGSRSARVGWAISTDPVVRFQLDERMGDFRSVVIQVYRIRDDRVDLSSGVALKEPGEPSVMVPGRDIYLPRPGGRVAIRESATGRAMPWFKLDQGAQYEVQFVVGGNREADALSVRVRTAAPGPAEAPTTRPDEPETPQKLPPGVIVPGSDRT